MNYREFNMCEVSLMSRPLLPFSCKFHSKKVQCMHVVAKDSFKILSRD